MAQMYAFCTCCGAAFPTFSAFTSDDSSISFIGCTAGPCPECGGDGLIPDGKYAFEGALVRFLSGPASSLKKLQEIADVVTAMQGDGRQATDILREVGRISPGLGSFGAILGHANTPAYLTLLVTIAFGLAQCKNQKLSDAAIEEGVRNALRDAAPALHQPPASSQIATPSLEEKIDRSDSAGGSNTLKQPSGNHGQGYKNKWDDFI